MNTTEQILVVHPEIVTGQAWLQALAEVGINGVVVSAFDEALAKIGSAPIQLVLIAESAESEEGFELADELRRHKPDVPMVMVLRAVELPLVVQGIRHGLTDVIPGGTDLAPLVRRVKALLTETESDEPSANELAAAAATLAQLDPAYKAGEALKKTDQPSALVEQQSRELQIEQQQVIAAQQAMDKKARLMAQEREAIQRENCELKAERIQWEQTLNELEVREENLRVFEQTLRSKQEKIDKELELDHSNLPGTAIDLAQAWEGYYRAAKILDSERASFRDERMVLKDLDKKIKERMAQLKGLDTQVSGREMKRRGQALPPPKAFAKSGSKSRAPMKVGFFRSILGGAR